jgi:hypothetical protein
MSAPDLYLVHYRLDDVKGTPGTCRTDYKLEKGEVLYVQNGRATVRSCAFVVEKPARVYLQGGNYRIA